MRDFRLSKTAGCLEDNFQIITSSKEIHRQDQDRTSQNKLCGQRKETTGKLKFCWETFSENSLSLSQSDVAPSIVMA